ncbi:MAG: porin [Polaromonas sp.]|nr:porin [Polaromonas sp.]
MKKTLIALAAVAATAGVAHAQSSVTLYGLVDAGFGRTTTQVGGGAKVSNTVVNSSGLNNSRWGLRGTEDLGGGLKANFVLESGFNTDTGSRANIAAQGDSMFGRAAWVGVSGGFGAVALGRQYTAYDALRGATNNNFDNNFATTNSIWGTGVGGYQNRASNAISYTSNVYGGFSGAVVYGFGEGATAAFPDADDANSASLHIKYANGPLLVGYAYQREEQTVGNNYFGSAGAGGVPATAALVADTRTYNLFAGSYNFGVVKLNAGYNRAEGDVREAKEYQVGLSAPLGATTLAVGYSRSKADGGGLADLKSRGYSASATYDLSKRTALYVGYLNNNVEAGAAAVETKSRVFLTGVKHVF